MRTLTSAQSNQLDLPHRSVHLRVRADRGNGDFVDLTDLEDFDFVDSVTYGEKRDAAVQSAMIKVRREAFDLSLSPFHDTSKLNLSGAPVSIGNPIIIETATIAEDQKPTDSDFVEKFRGEIDEIDLGKSIMTLKCRDDGGRLIDRFAEDQQLFPVQELAADDQMEDVIQDIVDYHNENLADTVANGDWDGTLTILFSSTSGLSVGDFTGIRGTTDASAFFPIASIVANVSVTVTNPQGRTVPNTGAAVSTQVITAATRVTLFSPNGTAAVPFNGSDAPGFQLNRFKNEKEALLPFARRIALLIGWDIGYKFQETVSAFELQLIGPERALAAQGALTFTGTIPLNAETFVVNATTFTARTSGAATDEWNIGVDGPSNATAVVEMFNAGSEKSNAFAFVDPGNSSVVVFAWGTLGTVGNAVVLTEALTGTTGDGGGTLGGTQTGTDGPTGTDHTFSPGRYRDVNSLKVSRKNIRNVIRVTFVDPVTNERVTVIRLDSASIAKYGRRYAEFTEDAAQGIDTISEAIDFADAALADLREPDFQQQVTHEYFWPVQINDTLTYEANGRHYTSDQTLSVVDVKHSLKANGDDTTIITVSGRPAGGVKRWFDIEGRRGIGTPIDDFIDVAPTGVVLTQAMGMIVLNLDDPRTASPPMFDWKTTRVHSEAGTADFTISNSNIVGEGRQLRFEFGDLVPGDSFVFKTVNIDEAGNQSTPSTFVATATQRVGPFHENIDGQGPGRVRNWDFNIFTLGLTIPPDFWTVQDGGTWASEVDVIETVAGTFTGNKAITLDVTAGVEPSLESDFVPFTEGDVLIVSALVKGDVTEANTDVRISVEWFTFAKATISTDAAAVTIANGVFENRKGSTIEAPATTRYFKIKLRGLHIGTNYTITLDRFNAIFAPSEFVAATVGQALTTSAVVVQYTNTIGLGISFNAGTDEYTVEIPGLYTFVFATVYTLPVSSTITLDFQEDVGAGFVNVAADTVNIVSPSGSSRLVIEPRRYIAGDRLRARVTRVGGTASIAGSGSAWIGDQLFREDQ